ncbi:hypothetical protein [Leeuwenhoekiella sp.]|uniref:Uncharacterized protein n=1 Tax=Leeuwenhoekiella blandensis (strain CECT 7118 / CCUG 51940 / KCTC 22103 / MED217) TaxID=398720 RepID=A3XQ69_LEEBM|nr:hypothetical protein MED217_00865 [Leeuwenhoekiella blandensis MED217]
MICLTFTTALQAQEYEFFGVIKLNDTSFISYKVLFDRVNDSIQGYSLTDFAGKHETKSNIKGYYNEDENLLSFEEYDIVYTKSPVVQKDFCFVNFEGKVRNLDRVKAFSGDFKGLYADGTSCLDGMIIVNSGQEVKKRVEKIDKVVQRSRKFSDSIKKNIKVAKVLDTLTRNIIAKDENLNIFTRDQKIKLAIYDAGKEDGDVINLYVDDKPVLENYTVLHEIKYLEFDLENVETKIRVEAVSEGTSSPNTVRLEVEDSRNFVRTITNLKEGEHAQMTLVKK